MTKSYRNNPRLNGIRQAIGIEGTDFELSEADLWTLFQFDVPADYDHFLQSCDQVRPSTQPSHSTKSSTVATIRF